MFELSSPWMLNELASMTVTRKTVSVASSQPEVRRISSPVAYPCAVLVATAGFAFVRAEMVLAAANDCVNCCELPSGKYSAIVGLSEKKKGPEGPWWLVPTRGVKKPAAIARSGLLVGRVAYSVIWLPRSKISA